MISRDVRQFGSNVSAFQEKPPAHAIPTVDINMVVTGGSGRLGEALMRAVPSALFPTRREMDITDGDSVDAYIREHRPDTIIHAAAMTDVRACETHWQRARTVNIEGTANVAIAAATWGATLVHISTACVFDGETGPFSESSRPHPKNYYALTKYVAEEIVATTLPGDHLIVRTNFVPFAPWPFPAAFTDRFGTYLFADDVAYALTEMVGKDIRGLVHICGSRQISMHDLASLTTPGVGMMTLQEYRGPPLTRDMSLVSERIAPYTIGVHVPRDTVASVIRRTSP